MPRTPDDHKFSDKEAKARFEAALRGGLSTPPKPLKSMTPKRSSSKAKDAAKPIESADNGRRREGHGKRNSRNSSKPGKND